MRFIGNFDISHSGCVDKVRLQLGISEGVVGVGILKQTLLRRVFLALKRSIGLVDHSVRGIVLISILSVIGQNTVAVELLYVNIVTDSKEVPDLAA